MNAFNTIATRFEIRNEEVNIQLPAKTREEAITQAKELGFISGLVEVFYPVLYTTNEAGMAYISDFLLEKHKHGEAITGDKKMMSAWAREAEDAIGNCGCPCFEIPSYFSTSGRSEVCFLEQEHFDSTIGEDEIDYEDVEITYKNYFEENGLTADEAVEWLVDTVLFDALKNGKEETARYLSDPAKFIYGAADGTFSEELPQHILDAVLERVQEDYDIINLTKNCE